MKWWRHLLDNRTDWDFKISLTLFHIQQNCVTVCMQWSNPTGHLFKETLPCSTLAVESPVREEHPIWQINISFFSICQPEKLLVRLLEPFQGLQTHGSCDMEPKNRLINIFSGWRTPNIIIFFLLQCSSSVDCLPDQNCKCVAVWWLYVPVNLLRSCSARQLTYS